MGKLMSQKEKVKALDFEQTNQFGEYVPIEKQSSQAWSNAL